MRKTGAKFLFGDLYGHAYFMRVRTMSFQPHRDDIDGLRAIAVLSVIGFHLGLPGVGGGFAGVDVFFVISGFLITKIILSELDAEVFSLPGFFARRMRRILPALSGMVAACLVASLAFMLPNDLSAFGRSAAAALLGVSNWYFNFNTGYFDQSADLAPLLHTWSLGVEEQFYLAWPAIIYFAFRAKRVLPVIALVAILSFAWNIVSINSYPKDGFYLPFARAWELAVGGILVFAPVIRRNWVGLAGLGAIAISVVAFNSEVPYPGIAALLPCLGTAAVIVSPLSQLGARPMVWIGRISYSLYLWHWPILVFFAYKMGHPPSSGPELTGVLSLTVVLALVSWRYIEVPFQRGWPTFTWPRVATASIAMVSVLGGISLLLSISGGVPQRFSTDELAVINDQPHRGVLDSGGRSCSTRLPTDPCIIGDITAVPSWALVGDSHAETLMKAVDEEWQRRGLAGFVFTLPGCAFILGSQPLGSGPDCASFVEQVIAELKSKSVKKVIIQDRANAYILGSRFDNQEGGVEPGEPISITVHGIVDNNRVAAVQAALLRTIATLSANDIQIYYLLAPPEVGWNAPIRTLEALRTGTGPVTTSLDVYLERNRPLITLLDGLTTPNVVVVPSYEAFCDEKTRRCAVTGPDGLLYTDTDHLSDRGARRLTDLLFRMVRP